MKKEILEIIRLEYGLPYLLEGANLGGLSTLNLIIKSDGEEFVLKKYQVKNIKKSRKNRTNNIFFKKK